jgi:predicted RNase H-like HicB family nuclease
VIELLAPGISNFADSRGKRKDFLELTALPRPNYVCFVKVRDILRISTGRSHEEVQKNMREAIAFHLDGLREEGQPVPEPQSYSAYVELPA